MTNILFFKTRRRGQTGQPTAGATDIAPGAGTAHPDGHYAREATTGGRRDERRKHAGRFYIIFYSVIIIYKEKCLYLGEIKRGYGGPLWFRKIAGSSLIKEYILD